MNIKESELKQDIYYVWKCPTCKTKAKEFEELEKYGSIDNVPDLED